MALPGDNTLSVKSSLRVAHLPLHDEIESIPVLNVSSNTSTRSGVKAIPPVPEPGRGGNDIESVIYVNLIPDIPEAKEQVKKLQHAHEITSQYFSVKAAESADLKIKNGELPGDASIESQTKRSKYRIAVIEYLVEHTKWLRMQSTQGMQRHFSVRKEEFHALLLKSFLEGLLIPESIFFNFEKILNSIVDGVRKTTSHDVEQYYWIMLTTYKWDPVQKRVFSSIRTIYFQVSQSLKQYADKKHTVTEVNMDLGYKQDDYQLTESIWDIYRDEVIELLSQNGVIDEPIVIPVGFSGRKH